MNLSSSFPDWLRALAGVSTAAVGLAWVATLCLRRQSAALRHLVWLLALCAPLLALPLGWLHPRVNLAILPRSSERGPTPGGAAKPSAALPPAEFPAADAVTAARSFHPAASPDFRSRFRLPVTLATGVWLFGAVVVGLRLLLAHLRLQRLVHASSSPAPPDLLPLLNEARQDFQFAGAVRLRVGPLTEIPFCQGVLRPIIHFPESWRQWDEERIQICLRHELAHLIRGDLLTLLAAQCACLLCWFQPLVWFAVARLRSEAERSADDLVLGRHVAPARYAANLVALAEDCRGLPPSTLSVAFAMARPHRLHARINAILDPTLRRRSPGRWTIFVVSFLALGALVAAMTVRLTAVAADITAAVQGQDLARLDSQKRLAILTAARAAIEAGDIQAIASFLQRGLDVNDDPDSNSSLLFEAVDNHQLGVVKFLLSKGADVNQKTSWGDTPVRRACWRGYKEIADTLIRAGAPLDELLYATGMGDVAGLEARDTKQPVAAKEARDAIHFAVASGHENTFDWLWGKLGPLDGPQKDKLLGDCFESAGKWGQAGMLRHLQGLGASPAKFGGRALADAVFFDHVEAARYLLEAGVSPGAVQPNQGNLLRNPVGQGHLEMVRLLLDHGADINSGDGRVLTPLSWAAYCGKEEVCLLLLERGADGGIEDDEGMNAAWRAAGGEHCPAALAVMLKKGVQITGKNKQGQTILNAMMQFVPPRPGAMAFLSKMYSASEMEAYDAREQRVVEMLGAAGLDCKGQEGTETPLMSALGSGHLAAARTLLKLGADLATKDQDGNNAIYYLVRCGWNDPLPLDVLETFLNHGGDPNSEVHLRGTRPPLASSLLAFILENAPLREDQAGFRRAIQMLIVHGARFPGTANEKAESLLQAAAAGNLPRIEESIRQGAPVNAADGDGLDALTVAVALDYDDCASWLLANGAVPAGHDVAPGSDVLTFAVEQNRADLVDALIAKGAKSKGAVLSTAIRRRNLHVFEALLKAGADPKVEGATETINGKVYTSPESLPLYLCIDRGQTVMAEMLLDKGANPDPNHLSNWNRSLAYWAVFCYQPQILQALLDHGADPTRKADDGDSALSLARKSHPDLVPMLEAATRRAQQEESAAEAEGRAAMNHKLASIIIPHVDFRAVPLTDAVETLRQEAVRLDTEPDPKERGVNIFLKLPAAAKPAAVRAQNAAGTVAPASPSGAAGMANAAPATPASRLITLHADHWPLLEVLRAVGSQIDMKVKVERYAVSLLPLTENDEQLYTAQCIVAAAVFGVPLMPSSTDASGQPMAINRVDVQRWLEGKGITFPPGASATYLPGSQKLVVRNTEENINRLKALFPPASAAPLLAVKINLTEHSAAGDKTLARPTLYIESGKQGIVRSGKFEYNVTPTLLDDSTVEVGVILTEHDGATVRPLAEQRTKAGLGHTAEVQSLGLTFQTETSLATREQMREIREAQDRSASPSKIPPAE